MNRKIIQKAIHKLIERKLTISFAESVSAGKMATTFCSIKGSGEILKGGIVSYHPDIKHKILGVKKTTMEKFTTESAECTYEMVIGLQKLFQTDICVAITGLASPGGSETPEKPIGTVFIAMRVEGEIYEFRKLFKGSSVGIINKSIEFTAQQIVKLVK